LAWYSAAVQVWRVFFPAPYLLYAPLLLVPSLIAIVVAQINRYRRVAAPAQRQQIKWVVFGMGSGFGCLGLVFLSYALFMVEGCKSMIDLLLSMGAGIPLVI
jgi:hypothetical protein